MRFPTKPDMLIPHLDPRKDTGTWARALLQLPANSSLMATSEWLTWPDWIKTWGEVTGVDTSYKQTTVEDIAEQIPGPAGKEIGEMFQFSSDFAYNAFQADTLKAWDLKEVSADVLLNMMDAANKIMQMGIEVRTTTLREYVEAEDWVAAGIVTA